eukprot:361284-Amphidinium_carterae.1
MLVYSSTEDHLRGWCQRKRQRPTHNHYAWTVPAVAEKAGEGTGSAQASSGQVGDVRGAPHGAPPQGDRSGGTEYVEECAG